MTKLKDFFSRPAVLSSYCPTHSIFGRNSFLVENERNDSPDKANQDQNEHGVESNPVLGLLALR